MSERSLLERLKRRKIAQRGFAYLAGAFVVFQGVEVMAEPWGLSASFQRTVHVLLLVGFFVQLVIAWYHGEKGRQRVSGPELLMLAAILVIAGVALSFLQVGPGSESRSMAPDLGDRPSIAVLPCENMSPDPSDEHLASGLHDEILLKLQQISALFSIGRTSVLQFSDNPPAVNEIAASLGVGHVGECSVRKEGERIRLTFQLLEGRTGGQVWANNYDRDLTVGNLLDIESDIAQQVARAIGAVLTPEEEAGIEAVPTENLEAYEAYLRPVSAEFQGYEEDALRYLVRMYQRAVELDPEFGLAYARLARAHAEMYWFTYDRSPERVRAAREALAKAVALAPDHAEVRLAAGNQHYYLEMDYPAATREFEAALSSQANHSGVLAQIGFVRRRMGDFEGAVEYLHRALDIDPLSPRFALNLGQTYQLLRNYSEALRFLDLSISLLPGFSRAYASRAMVQLAYSGDVQEARRSIEEGILAGASPDADHSLAEIWIWVDMLDRRFGEALGRMDLEGWEVLSNQFFHIPGPLLRAQLHQFSGNLERARTEYEMARSQVTEALERTPDDERLFSSLGIALAGLGLKEEALAAAERGLELMPETRDAYKAMHRLQDLARVSAMVGEQDRAIELLKRILSRPGRYTTHILKLDPTWDPLRTHPGFQALLERYAGDVER